MRFIRTVKGVLAVVRVPTVSKPEVQALAARAWVSHMLDTLGFLQGKFGEQSVKAYIDWMGSQTAKKFKAARASSPAKFAEANARTAKNVYGGKVKLKTGPDRAILRIIECGWLKALTELPASIRASREDYCNGCLAFFSVVAANLGLNLKGKLLEKGCRMAIRKKA